jgi:DNA-binding NarL/FixJ family response regulator
MKIGIADPQGRVRFSLRVLLEQQPGWMVAGEAADGDELFLLLSNSPTDLLLIDWDVFIQPPGDTLLLLQSRYPKLRILILSGKQELRQAAIEAGADAFACKTEPPEKLLSLIYEMINLENETSCQMQTSKKLHEE